MNWGVVATAKSTPDKVMAFIAHHLSLGASKVHIFFDDPEDEAFFEVRSIQKVRATQCDDMHWARFDGRPSMHQNRQAKNAMRAYYATSTDWLCHIDVDEFLAPKIPVCEVLSSLPPAQTMVRMEPFEAISDPLLPDDIFTAKFFRGALRGPHERLKELIFGEYAEILPEGMLSHSRGKAFFRTKVKGLVPRIHGASLNGTRISGIPFESRIDVLHFHASDKCDWLTTLPYRLAKGAYRSRLPLADYLRKASPAEVARFYLETQQLTKEKIGMLQNEDRIVSADLALKKLVSEMRL